MRVGGWDQGGGGRTRGAGEAERAGGRMPLTRWLCLPPPLPEGQMEGMGNVGKGTGDRTSHLRGEICW